MRKKAANNLKVMEAGIAKANRIKDALVINALKQIGKDALNVAQDTHTFDNQSKNLEDSFTYGLFHNGVMIEKKSIGSSNGTAIADTFLGEYTPTKTFELVVVAGAKYGQKLEGWVRSTDGVLSKAGDTLIVLNESFVFVSTESIDYFTTK